MPISLSVKNGGQVHAYETRTVCSYMHYKYWHTSRPFFTGPRIQQGIIHASSSLARGLLYISLMNTCSFIRPFTLSVYYERESGSRRQNVGCHRRKLSNLTTKCFARERPLFCFFGAFFAEVAAINAHRWRCRRFLRPFTSAEGEVERAICETLFAPIVDLIRHSGCWYLDNDIN